MHAPGPPRVTVVGDAVELAPRSPDPEVSYRWSLAEAPDGSELRVGDGPVVHPTPDVPGRYAFELEAAGGRYRQRVRAFPDDRRETTIRVPHDDLPEEPEGPDAISVMGPFNDRLLARDRPVREGDEWVWETRLPPGDHRFGFVVDDDLTEQYRDVHEVPGPGRPRLSLDAHLEDDAVVVTADVASPPGSDRSPDDLAVEFFLDDRDADPDTVAAIEDRAAGHALRVPVDQWPGQARVHAVPVGERPGVVDAIEIDVTGDETAIARPAECPDWAHGATIYEVFARTFAGETVDTTFDEIARRVPYLEHLGVDVLWLTPVLASPTRHGYHITDFFETAADLGSREAFEALVDRCHEAGIRVIFDLVINHTSRDHPAFQLHSAGVEEYADHYRRAPAEYDIVDVDWASPEADWTDPAAGSDGSPTASTTTGGPAGDSIPEYYFNWRSIPNLNYDSLAVREWMLSVVDEWVDVVDGFRADVAWGVPHGFWKEVAARVPEDFLLLDETVPHDPEYSAGEFHVHYDTSLYYALRDVGAGDRPADAVHDALERGRWLGFPDHSRQMRYVENHDEDRYLAEYGEHAMRAAVGTVFTLPGLPMIYAGAERGNETDRGPVRWHDGDTALTEFHRDLVALRDDEPALRDGSVERLDLAVADGDADRVTGYARAHGGDRLVVLVHFGEGAAVVDVDGTGTTDLISGSDVGVDGGLRVQDVVVVRGE